MIAKQTRRPPQPHETRLRVRYAETDQMGVVYYSNYIVWMEIGRVEFFRTLGFNYRDMEIDDNVLLAVVEARCRYVSPARYDDEVVMKTWIEDANQRSVRFGYEMCHADDGRVLATGETRHFFLNRELKRTKLPQKYHASFGIDGAA